MTPELEIARANAQRIVNAGGTDAIDYPVAVGFLSLIAQVEALTRKEKALQGLADERYAEVLELTAQLSEALTVPQVIVRVERGGVYIVKGAQFFRMAYEGDEPVDLEWYAGKLRAALAAPTIPAIPGTKEDA